MTDRKSFEAWYCRKFHVDSQCRLVRLHFNMQGRYSNNSVQIRWEAWEACAAAMEALEASAA